MNINPQSAVSAYQKAAFSGAVSPDQLAQAHGLSPIDQGQHVQGTGFANILSELGQSAIDANRHAENVSERAIAGTAGVSEVVEALASAETTLKTVTAIRDKVVSAYQEILKTPI